jgi:LPS sulfotransferase NodH
VRRKSYIVASTRRSGSAFLCRQLWKTGLLGAPSEYFSYPGGRLGRRMAKRLEPSSHADYLAKVIARRTSKNGVFGLKVQFEDFARTLAQVPEALSMLAPVTYIFVDRDDKLSQAADVAISVQANRRIATAPGAAEPLCYDRNLISKCLGLLERGRLDWTRWFESNAIDPFVVTYEDLAADKAGVIRSIVELLDVQGNEPEEVPRLAHVELPTNGINDEWAARFEREIQNGIRLPDA